MVGKFLELTLVVSALLLGRALAREEEKENQECEGQLISCDSDETTKLCLETFDPAAILKACGECPKNQNCDPEVRTSDIHLVSHEQVTKLTITGIGFTLPDIQIVIYTETSEERLRKREVDSSADQNLVREKRSITVREMAQIVDIVSSTEMIIEIHNGLTTGASRNRLKETFDGWLAIPTYLRKNSSTVLSDDIILVMTEINILLPDNVNDLIAEYKLGARVGIYGTEYKKSDGPAIYVYSESGFTTSAYSPNEVDLGQAGSKLNITFTTIISDDRLFDYSGDTQMFGIVSDSVDIQSGSMTSEPAIVYDPDTNKIVIEAEMPDQSKELWVCPSVNGQLGIRCKSVKFYIPAPTVINNEAKFSESGDSVFVIFTIGVEFSTDGVCTDIFTDISSFGNGPTCKFSVDRNVLTIHLGDLSTLKPGNTLTLKAGLVAATGAFRREMSTSNITVTGKSVDEGSEKKEAQSPGSILDVSPRGYWPRELTGCAKSPVTLGINIGLSTSGRSPELIVWTVNEVTQDAARDQLELEMDVASPGTYDVTVVVTDFLGGSTTLTHTIIKNTLPIPYVTFTPYRLRSHIDGTFRVHPGEPFAIGTTIQYTACLDGHSESLDNFYFNWTRNDEPIEGHFIYKTTGLENTIQMCGNIVRYKLDVIRKADLANHQETYIDVKIECRNVIARIIGNSYTELAVSYPHKVPIDGSFSYDPDGGQLIFSWTCTANGEVCPNRVGISSFMTHQVLMIYPSNLEVGVVYRFTLVVSVTKSDGIYTATSFSQYRITGEKLPTIRIITLEHNFRRNVRILLKANVTIAAKNYNMTAKWRFVQGIDGYDWLDLSGSDDTNSNLLPDYLWYTIPPNTLTVGQRYKMRVSVTLNNDPAQTSTQDHDIYIYQNLRRCEIKARDITELQKTQLLIQNCITDPLSTWLEVTCELQGKKLQSTDDLTFNIPIFVERTVTKANFTCKVRDSLGHTMVVESNEVRVTLLTNDRLNQVLQERINDETLKGNIVDVMELRASKIDNDGENSKRFDHRQLFKLLKELRMGDPSPRDLKRAIKSAMVVQPDKLNKKDREAMVHQIYRTLKTLGSQDGSEQATKFTDEEIKEIINTAKRVVTEDKHLRSYYRDILESTACLQIKGMKNDEKSEMDLGDGAKKTVAVLTLDDTVSDSIGIPEDLKDRFRSLWQCTPSDVCDDVAMVTGEYPSDPPDLQTGRIDSDCAQYTTLDLYNPKTCKSIPVKNNFEPIEIKMTTTCLRPKCYYYEEVTESFDDHQLVTKKDENGSVVCQSNHLTTFTLKTEPIKTIAQNIPLFIAAIPGSILCAVAVFLLIKAYCMTKLEEMRREEAEERKLEEWANFNRTNAFTYHNSLYDHY